MHVLFYWYLIIIYSIHDMMYKVVHDYNFLDLFHDSTAMNKWMNTVSLKKIRLKCVGQNEIKDSRKP